MKKIHITEEQINMAGTDTPSYYDEKTDTWYEGSWNDMYAYPFGYWPTNFYGNEIFCIGDAYSTHANACGKAVKIYFMNAIREEVQEDAITLEDLLSDFVNDLKTYNYHYDEENDVYVSEDGSDEFDVNGKTDEIRDELNIINYDYVKECVEYAIENLEYIGSNEIEECLMNYYEEEHKHDFEDKEGLDAVLNEIGSDFYSFFEQGRNEGRIWPDDKLISFYVTEQPDPETLNEILIELNNSEIGVSYEELLNFIIIFENYANGNGEVTACTVADYMSENYGETDEKDDEDDEEEIQYAKQGKTQFVPHLANQGQKREFFKDFRNTRDQAIYAPREKAANSLAQYHAMRYPYGESIEKKTNKIIKEEIFKYLTENE